MANKKAETLFSIAIERITTSNSSYIEWYETISEIQKYTLNSHIHSELERVLEMMLKWRPGAAPVMTGYILRAMIAVLNDMIHANEDE